MTPTTARRTIRTGFTWALVGLLLTSGIASLPPIGWFLRVDATLLLTLNRPAPLCAPEVE